ncbi:MAG: mechanosensitive ion channel [Spirochaetia bacterium]|nr:mechanosensitive ion channel [Spirochaetia bacterium]MBP5739589.1 mechanosensitive ion channel [Spirochaetia bacterium]
MENILPEEVMNVLNAIYAFINKPFLSAGSINISILTLLLFIPVIIIAQKIGKIVGKIVKFSIKNKPVSETSQFRIVKIVSYGITVLALFIGFTMLGINLSSIAVILGALGIGVGFGLQTLISNFSAGLVILFTGPIKEGDRITIAGTEGYITKINFISTVVTTLMNETLIVPNSMLISEVCHSHTFGDDKSVAIDTTIKIDYSADVDKAMKVMAETLEKNPANQEGAKADVRIASFEELGIQLIAYIKIANVDDKGTAKSWNNIALVHAFQEQGIPLPSRRIQIKNI